MMACCLRVTAQQKAFQTAYATIAINAKGEIISIKDKKTKKEYCFSGKPSALLSLYKGKAVLRPQAAQFNDARQEVELRYDGNITARVSVAPKDRYLKLQLINIQHGEGVDNIVWGPYNTTIAKTIGEIIGVVRDDHFAIGMMALDDNTTSGPPTDGDMPVTYYYIHSPDPVKYPLPPHLREGQTFKIGGDGTNDIAFYSQPEEYFRMNYGNAAWLEPAFGSAICMHARNRRKEQMIRFPVLPDNLDGGYNSARYQLVLPVDADFKGSAVALYACPDSLGLQTIEKIVLKEGLPHPTMEGKWIKDPASFRTDIAWWGTHDSLASYAAQLGVKAVQDEGWGEYYPNPANRWGHKKISLNSAAMTIPAFGAAMQAKGIRYGLHTLCEFLQPDNNSDVAPVPSDSLAIMQRTVLTQAISVADTLIRVADTAYFNEFGGWEGNHTNVLKIGKELIGYNGITTTYPYTFQQVKRGLYGSARSAHQAGDTIVKLQPNCYRGFAPDMHLQQNYAAYYGRWLTEGGMDYIDFDGLESCIYQGHGQYSFKQFFRKLFDTYHQNGGVYLRVMGSCVYEGNWHYMSVCNVGGGDHMFDPVHNKWGIEGKDMRYVFESNYFPATFGIINFSPAWSLYDGENLQAKAIGWNAMYMLGLSQETVERSGEKAAFFDAFRTWEDARAANIFTPALKAKLKQLDRKFHLEKHGKGYTLYTLKEDRLEQLPLDRNGQQLQLPAKGKLLEWSIRLHLQKGTVVNKLILKNGKREIVIDQPLTDKQFIICKQHQLYIADANRNSLRVILPEALDGLTAIEATYSGSGGSMEWVRTTIASTEKI